MEAKIVYFEKLGKRNTDETLLRARQRANELGIRKMLVASSSGDTGAKAVNVFKGLEVVVVTHSIGDIIPNTSRFTEENRKFLDSHGAITLRTTDPIVGISESLGGGPFHGTGSHKSTKVSVPARLGSSPGELIATTLGMFCRGMKVACSITMMAADAGLARTDEDVISIAGTRAGADTAIVIRPSNTHRFYNLRINQVICKPRL